MELSEEQKRIVRSDARRLVVLAGPGSGKTSMGVMRRVARLLEEGVDPSSIRMISFTRTAAQDLKEKVEELEGEAASKVRASTVHSMCLAYLVDYGVLARAGRSPRFLLRHERDQMLHDIRSDLPNIYAKRAELVEFESGWITNPSSYPGTFIPDPNSLDFQSQVQLWLQRHKAMLVGEVVPLAVRHLEQEPTEAVFPDLRHLIVDEYQDLNYLEQYFIDLAAQNGSNLVIVGDDDQSIYGFKHAHPDGIRGQVRLSEGNDDVEVVQMNVCRRSPSNVIAAGNRLMRYAPGRSKDDMEPAGDRVGYVAKVQWTTLEDEIAGVSAAIAHAVTSRDIVPDDILLLVPNRKIGRRFVNRLTDLDIPVEGYFDQDVLDGNTLGQRAVALFDLLANPDDPLAWRVLWGLENMSGTVNKYTELVREAREQRKTPIQFIREAEPRSRVARRYERFYRRYNEISRDLTHLADSSVQVAIDALLPEDNPDLVGLRAIASQLVLEDPEMSISDFVTRYRGDIALKEYPERSGRVRVMTLHKSKGLTAECVFVTSLVDGLVPNCSGCEFPEDLQSCVEEGRRLLYVAMTRSASELVLSTFRLVDNGEGRRMKLEPVGPYAGGNRAFPVSTTPYFSELGDVLGRTLGGTEWDRQYSELGAFEYRVR